MEKADTPVRAVSATSSPSRPLQSAIASASRPPVSDSAAVGAFCAREGISDSSFGRWRSLLGDAGQVTGTATAVERTGFVDAGRIGLSGDERIEVKLELGGGVVLHVVRG